MNKKSKVLLLYPPTQSLKDYTCKPNGSLAYPSLAGSLLNYGVDVEIYDATVGDYTDDLNDAFYDARELPSGLVRTGVSDNRILDKVSEFDVIGLTSIFTAQETMVLDIARLINIYFSDKLIIAGGANARSRVKQFLSNGVSVVCLSEAEHTIKQLISTHPSDWSKISSIAYMNDGKIVINKTKPQDITMDLDTLPLPAWDLLPNERYWKIRRPHGGWHDDSELKYASIMTSLGCPFSCSYCHTSKENTDDDAGNIGRFRIKSDDRVLQELNVLKGLGVKQVYIEDDSLFGYKRRGINLIKKVKDYGFDIFDGNGINIVHLFRGADPDIELIEALADAGFKEIVLPFENASQRIINKYVSKKWVIDHYDIRALIETLNKYNIRTGGNYMLGFPDETRGEIENTVEMAKRHKDYGITYCSFLCTMPLPGSRLFDIAMDEGYLDTDINPDMMCWNKYQMKNTEVPGEEIEDIREKAWTEINDSRIIKYKTSTRVEIG